jgi:7-cyano-7-deazaguanine synthase
MVLVLMSGGVDSTLLAARAHASGQLGALLFIDYGQPAARMESQAVTRWSYRRKVEAVRLTVRMWGVGDAMRIGVGAPGLRIVPGRNLILVSHAINIAKVRGFDEVWIGANADDISYPDCRARWIDALDELAISDVGVRLCAPLVAMSKTDIMSEAQTVGVDISETWSCYQPLDMIEPCGSCHSCIERAAALRVREC